MEAGLDEGTEKPKGSIQDKIDEGKKRDPYIGKSSQIKPEPDKVGATADDFFESIGREKNFEVFSLVANRVIQMRVLALAEMRKIQVAARRADGSHSGADFNYLLVWESWREEDRGVYVDVGGELVFKPFKFYTQFEKLPFEFIDELAKHAQNWALMGLDPETIKKKLEHLQKTSEDNSESPKDSDNSLTSDPND